MNIRIVVTEEDIWEGCRFSPDRCPIARAITRAVQLPGVAKYGVGVTQVTLYTGTNVRYHADVPGKIQAAIVQFDRTGCMELLEFDLEFEKCRGT